MRGFYLYYFKISFFLEDFRLNAKGDVKLFLDLATYSIIIEDNVGQCHADILCALHLQR